MSRIGKIPIAIPKGITVKITGSVVHIKGPKGSLQIDYHDHVKVEEKDNKLHVERFRDDKQSKSFHGLYQRVLSNMIHGVEKGFTRDLEIIGLGYKAAIEGKRLVLNLGFSHAVHVTPPDGISFEVPTPNKIIVKGIDKHQVGQVAANLRKIRPPEPYKGKGIRYVGEYVKRKVGKTGGK